ncbi:transient receptor potential-gamma protein-like [Limulus polyphemus]|uniref:Transient receptor potential ion channel subfamily C trpgamma-like protein n=1 Tax=Limulus polyphemus TaxID=6850 RepID=A0A059XPJ5_LIMPO|nr:transient receptor potential-gamma protein-like [Limulus polyphemus]AIA22827.1 transient receptor potential ion channel subfamily C trpgamma-like protein [Limulus polyphemus]
MEGKRYPSSSAQFSVPKREGQLSFDEKKFLLSVERGDLASVRRYLESNIEKSYIDINCVDPLGRSGLLMAIDNENLEMLELLIDFKVETKDALLHAISEEFVEAVEVLLEHEENTHNEGEPHSWEAIDRDIATFTPDITPLTLAAHRDNYEIIKILLDRGATLPTPHHVRCGCKDCVVASSEDSLRHSRSRINAYLALASPSLIALSSKDPILTAFELSWELRQLSFMEHEFKNDYQDLRRQCQNFATALLDHTRSSYELEVMLNYVPSGPAFHHGDRMHLSRLKLAIRYKQKKFCAHPNVQQLLASIWYEGLPGFRRKNVVLQCLEIFRIGALFPLYSTAYILAPYSRFGRTIRRPFIKFICHSASYVTFLFLLILASQRVDSVLIGWFETKEMNDMVTKRGAPPSIIEWMILAWVAGLIWSEIKQLWESGLIVYISDMWNIIDFITNALYVATVALRIVAYFQVQKEIILNTGTAYLPRERWDAWDPILIAEGLFAAANIFSSLKLVYIFSVNPHLGPLQICLGRMVIDILKFFFVYTLVLFAFACGMNQLLWCYADLEKKTCEESLRSPHNKTDPVACLTWRRFANVFESSQTLFWASFGLIDLDSFELTGIKSYTRFWGMLMFGTYSVINIVVLLNLLIAMMNHSYQMISEQADTEWKFARSKLWMSYFEDGATVPPPFNIIPTPKSFYYLLRWVVRKFCGYSRSEKKENIKTYRKQAKKASERNLRYQTIMRNLVRRYITKEQRRADHQGVTEDDVNEIKQDISSFRYELMEILKNSGFNTSVAKGQSQGAGGKKGRLKERRLMKGFNIGLVEESEKADLNTDNSKKSATNRFVRAARLACENKNTKRRKWDNLVEATKNARAAISKGRSEESKSEHESSENQSQYEVSSESNASVVLSPDACSAEEVKKDQLDTVIELPETKLARFGRKFGSLTFTRSKLRFTFQDQNKYSAERVQSVPKLTEIPEKWKMENTVSDSGPSLLQSSLRACSLNSLSDHSPPPSVTSIPLKVVVSERRSPSVPSCVESNISMSFTGSCDFSQNQNMIYKVQGEQPNKLKRPFVIPIGEASHAASSFYGSSDSNIPGVIKNSFSCEQTLIRSDKTANGPIKMMSRVHGIEPADKQMSIGWI